MVRGIPLQQREFFPPGRDNNWHTTDRTFLDSTQDGRFATSQPIGSSQNHAHPLTIETALRDCAHLRVKEFALFALLENGEENAYTSQVLTPFQQRIFTNRFREDFRRSVRRANDDGHGGSGFQDDNSVYDDFSVDDCRKQSTSGESSSGRSRRHFQRQSRSVESDEVDPATGKRKRARGVLYPGTLNNDDTPASVPVQRTQQLTISNDKEVDQFYNVRFKDMQQSSCKIMGKAFVKLVEPKKQTHFPYTKGDGKAPPWWPITPGDYYIEHKEPDHLKKPQRIHLLVHILKMIIEPYDKQYANVQKLRVNVRKLEEVTMEAMNLWFNDPAHPENLAKRPFLREIFKVAKVQERYKNGEIGKSWNYERRGFITNMRSDGDTRVPVMYGDRTGFDPSEDEVEDGVKNEDEDSESTQVPANIPTPESLISQPMMQGQHLHQPLETESNPMFMAPTRPVAVRYQTQPQLEEHGNFSTLSFPRTLGFQSQSPNPQEPSRRSFDSPVYTSPQSVYGWQTTPMASNAAMSSNFYVTSPSTLGPQAGQYQLPPPATSQQPPMLPPVTQLGFDGLPVHRHFESGSTLGNQLRTGSLGHPHHMPHGFQDYLHDTSNYGHNDSEVRDDHQLHQ